MAELTIKPYRTPVMKRIGGFLLLAVGVMFLAFTAYYAAKDFPLWVFGKQTKAEVVEIWIEQLNELQGREDGVLDYSYNVKYQFTTSSGKVITKTTQPAQMNGLGCGRGKKLILCIFPCIRNSIGWTIRTGRFSYPVLTYHSSPLA